MRVLVACEFWGKVRDAFTRRGHYAVSCDLLPSKSPGLHIQGDVLDVLGDGWDLMLAFPPCTYLCSSGLHWNKRRPERAAQTEAALGFVSALLAAPIKKKALENPVGCISTRIRKPDQIIQPNQFGHAESKTTCLWLEGLPPLIPTNRVSPAQYRCSCGAAFPFDAGLYGCPNCHGEGKVAPLWDNMTVSGQNKLSPSADRWALRSETYAGIADAMAEQWGGLQSDGA